MNDEQSMYSTWVTVDLDAINNNVRFILKRSKVQVMAIVKANAYGHGAVPVAQAALKAGATWCGIARVSEALELRQAGLDCPILILGYTPRACYAEMIKNQVSMTVWDIEQIKLISTVASQINRKATLHLKVDTGMGRLGVDPDAAIGLLREIAGFSNVQVEGLFTHFARADEAVLKPTDVQEKLFQGLVEKLKAENIHIPLIHAANSAASLTHPSVHFNCVRFGIAMYGLHPSTDCPLPMDFKPALKWKSVLSQVKILPSGRGISYGHDYVTTREERIGIVPVGYADGFRRVPGNYVLVGGHKVPVVGRVTMDQIMVQLDAVADAVVGDEVVLIGAQGRVSITAEEIASRWGTINYEVTSGIAHRVPRIY
ncbi:MAG: alanine racemase [Anaerolineales bacterium]